MSEIEIKNLTKTFEVKGRTIKALDNININIENIYENLLQQPCSPLQQQQGLQQHEQ